MEANNNFYFGDYILDNFRGSLTITGDHITIKVYNANGDECTAGSRALPIGNYTVETIIEQGYELDTLTLNGEPLENNSFIVEFGDDIEIVATMSGGVAPSYPIYGVEWANDDTTTMIRTDDAINMTYAINNSTGEIASDFNNVFPWNEAEILTDNLKNKFIRMPEMWFRVTYDSNNYITGVAVSKTRGSGDNWYQVKTFDYGLYGGSVTSNKLCSKAGVFRFATPGQTKLSDWRRYASANSESGYIYHQIDIKSKFALIFLWWIEFATKNSSNIMLGFHGNSPSDFGTPSNYQKVDSGLLAKCGLTDSLTTPSGFLVNGGEQMRYHYIEDFFGQQFESIDGIILINGETDSDEAYYGYSINPAEYNDVGEGYNITHYKTLNTGVIKAWFWDEENPFLVTPECLNSTDYTIGFCDKGMKVANPSNSTTIYMGSKSILEGNAFGATYFTRRTTTLARSYYGARLMRQPISNFN